MADRAMPFAFEHTPTRSVRCVGCGEVVRYMDMVRDVGDGDLLHEGCELACEHEQLTDDKAKCLDCGMEFVACRACYVLGSGVPVYHSIPECPITDEEWAEVLRKERETL